MTKVEQRNRLKTSRCLARIMDMVCNCPDFSMHINNADILGVYNGADMIKYIKVCVKDVPEPIKAAYVVGKRSKSLEDMEEKVEAYFHQFEKEKMENVLGI